MSEPSKLDDFDLIEKANLGRNAKLGAQMAISGLHCLRAIAKKRGIPMDDLTAKHVIEDVVSESAGWKTGFPIIPNEPFA